MSEENVQTPTTSSVVPTNVVPPQVIPKILTRADKIRTIQKQKQDYCSFPLEKKLQKLANHSKCQTESCSCEGWRNAKDPNKIDLCSCGHILEMHVSHLREKSEMELNQLLSRVVDIETILVMARNNPHQETKQYYLVIFKVVRRCRFSFH